MSTPTEAHALSSFDGSPPRTGPMAHQELGILPALPPPLRRMAPHASIIQAERSWRQPDFLTGNARANSRLIAARWIGADFSEKTSEITGDYHMLSIALQPTEFSIWLGTRSFPNKSIVTGTIQLTAPALPARIVYHRPYDTLHLFIKNALLKELFAWAYGKAPIGDVVLRDPNYAHDPQIGQLGLALSSADAVGGAYAELYAESLSLAIVSRLFALYAERPASTPHRTVAALPNWRLKRVIDFMESHGEEPITLADLARIAGLSRMHFAAQFRKATGLRPHEYLLSRRVEKAKIMLQTSALPVVEVALTVGFNSQSHFTGVFKRFTGLPPLRWRELSRG